MLLEAISSAPFQALGMAWGREMCLGSTSRSTARHASDVELHLQCCRALEACARALRGAPKAACAARAARIASFKASRELEHGRSMAKTA